MTAALTDARAAEIVTQSYVLTEIAANMDPDIAAQNRIIAEQKKAYEERAAAEAGKTGNELVIESWEKVKAIPDYQKVAGEILFRRIFELNGDALGIFSFAKEYKPTDDALYKDAAFVAHSTSVVGTVTAAVELLEKGDMDTLVTVLQDLGGKHAKFGFTKVHYDLVGESLIYTLDKGLGNDFTPKVKESWLAVYGVITEQMMAGAKNATPAAKPEKELTEEERQAAALVTNSYVLTEEAANKVPSVAEANKKIAEDKKKYEDSIQGSTEVAETKKSLEETNKEKEIPADDTEKVLSTEDDLTSGKRKNTTTWKIQKKDKGSRLGISFTSKGGVVSIYDVQGRAQKKTNLVPGLQVVQVCGQNVTSAKQAAQALEQHPGGTVLIVTVGTHHTARRKTSKDKAGFAIQPYAAKKGFVAISRVNPRGIFPDLQVGHILWSVNGAKVTSVEQAIKVMKKKMELRLVVVDPADLESNDDTSVLWC